MKRILKIFVFIFVLFGVTNVYAENYDVGTLIPVSNNATVETDVFTYNDISLNNYDNSGYRLISFQSITRKSKGNSPIPVSINVLLFDSEEKNIGFVTYCSEKDYDGDYSGYTIKASQSSPFTIKIVKKYFASKDDTLNTQYSIDDIAYYSVLDDNHFCKVGGYDKYKGLTLEQINNGELSSAKTKTMFSFSDIIPSISGGVLVIIIILLIIFIALFVFGSILNVLYKRMYAEKSALAYVPFTNMYVCVKMAFGKMIAFIYLIMLFIFSALYFINAFIGSILISLLGIFSTAAFIVDIIKIITKKYDMFYFEPSVKNNINEVSSYNSDVSTNSAYLNRDESLLNNSNSMSLDGDSNFSSNNFNNISSGNMNNSFNFNDSNLNNNTSNFDFNYNSNTSINPNINPNPNSNFNPNINSNPSVNSFNGFDSNSYNISNNISNTSSSGNSIDALYDSINNDDESDNDMLDGSQTDMFNMNGNDNNQDNHSSLFNTSGMDGNRFFGTSIDNQNINRNNDQNNSDGGSDLSNMFR